MPAPLPFVSSSRAPAAGATNASVSSGSSPSVCSPASTASVASVESVESLAAVPALEIEAAVPSPSVVPAPTIAPPVRTTPKAGDILAGKYKVEEVLGAGGMGVVLAARHLQLDERVAIKLLLPEFANNDEVVARFLREGRAAIKIRSQHVVRVLDVDALETGAPYLVMECLSGRDLELLLHDDGPLAVDRAVDLLLQACEALAEAHSLGIVHRDLKPANLFLTRSPDDRELLKVLDFGISKLHKRTKGIEAARITNTSAIMGSPHYMSPEQLRSTRDVDARADIWALGIVLHELLSGTLPFAGNTMPVVCAAILKEPPPRLRDTHPEIAPGVEAAVLRCLDKDPDARFQNVAEVAVALAPYGSENARASADRIRRILHAVDVVSATELDVPVMVEEDQEPRISNVTTETSWSARHAAHRPSRSQTATVVGFALAGTLAGLFGVHSYIQSHATSTGATSAAKAPAPVSDTSQAAIVEAPTSTAELTAATMAAAAPVQAPQVQPTVTAQATDAGIEVAAPKPTHTTAPSTRRAHAEDDPDRLFDERK